MAKPDQNEGARVKGKRMRSPNFPCIGLREAMGRAQQVYDKWKRAQVPSGLVHAEWGYKSEGAAGYRVGSALKAFGLVEVEGEGQARLKISDSAYKIIEGHQDKKNLLQKAALSPSVYEELWTKFAADGFPQDVMKHYLHFDRTPSFNPEAIAGLIGDFLDTISLAELGKGDTITGAGGSADGETPPPPLLPLKDGGGLLLEKPNMFTDTFNIEEGTVALQYPNSLSQASYEDLESWVALQLKKIKRRVRVTETPSGAEGETK